MNSVTESKQHPAGTDPIDLLRRFHYGEPVAVANTEPPAGAILPALLNPYRDAAAVRYQYPLYLPPADDAGETGLAKPLGDFLADAVRAFAPGDDSARILKDNLPWLERYLRQALQGPDPVGAAELFAAAAAALQDHLELGQGNRQKLESDLDALGGAIAAEGQFLAYGPDASLHLLLHAIRNRGIRQRRQLRDRLDRNIRRLQALLQVEKSKDATSTEPGSVKSSVGPAGRHLDPGALSQMLEKRTHGSLEMTVERRARIQRALATMQGWQDDPVLVRFVGGLQNPWFRNQPSCDVIDSDEPCAAAADVFEQEAARYAKLFAALRLAALETDDNYDPAIHDSWFASFDWQAFSAAELQLVTRVVALVSADHLAGDGLPSFSQLLGSRKPVHVLSWVRAYDNPAARPGEGPFDGYRFELAFLGIGHRHVVVAQTSAARHEDLLAGFCCALDANRTSLHLVNRGAQTSTKEPLLEPWFVAGAALESRAHPFLLVNPDAGDRAAQRVSFAGNPQADRDWPAETLEHRGGDGETTTLSLAFTFADYALLIPALHEHFRRVPAGFDSADLVPVDDYLQTEGEPADRRVPYVWGIDDEGALVRLVVSRALVFACRDRLNYWHTLQELAGIRNFYVEAAVTRAVEEQRAALEAEREELLKAHQEQLESARSEAAGDAMGQLVDVLMGADLSSMIGDGDPLGAAPSPEAAASAAPAVEPVPAPEPEPEEEEEALSFDEPWLDTAACTTCDDCMGINKMMFAYNDDKQAFLRDPRAGPYADLVEAAEICPAKCIHPGKPLDPNEPGLEELIARAEPFN